MTEPERIDPEHLEEPAPEPRRYPSTLGGAFYLGLLAVAAAGILLAWAGDWRLGVRFLGGALIAGAVLRLVIPERDAGMLAVRHRAIDIPLLASVGAILIFLAHDVPPLR